MDDYKCPVSRRTVTGKTPTQLHAELRKPPKQYGKASDKEGCQIDMVQKKDEYNLPQVEFVKPEEYFNRT